MCFDSVDTALRDWLSDRTQCFRFLLGHDLEGLLQLGNSVPKLSLALPAFGFPAELIPLYGHSALWGL